MDEESKLDKRQSEETADQPRKKVQKSLTDFFKPSRHTTSSSDDTSTVPPCPGPSTVTTQESGLDPGETDPESTDLDPKDPVAESAVDEYAGTASLNIPEDFLSAEIHHPRDRDFPLRTYGKQKLSFQAAWFQKFPWLHYCESTDSVLCYLCINAPLLSCTKKEDAFTSTGFCNWKKALQRFEDHQKSATHRTAAEEVILPSKCGDIGEILSSAHQKEKTENRQMLIEILRNTRYLARQALPLRGDDERDGNFFQLMALQAQSDERVSTWLRKTTNKYISKDIQNEQLRIMAFSVLRELTRKIQEATWYTIMADEVTDSSNKEQLVICLQWINGEMEAEESFVGLYQVHNTKSDTIVAAITDGLMQLNIALDNARGQCYDGASNMSGYKPGVCTQIQKVAPKAVFTHCYGHSLQLAVGDTKKQVKELRDVFDTTEEISKLIKFSPKRNAIFDKIKPEMAPDTPGFRVLCPTRWTVCGNSLQSILDNYEVLHSTWEETLNERLESDMRARVIGVQHQMNTFTFYFGVCVAVLILKMTDNLSKTLQHSYMSASEAQQIASGTVKTLAKMRTDPDWELFWKNTRRNAKKLGLPDAGLPRRRQAPARYEVGEAAAEHPKTPESYFHRIWNEAFDTATQGINERFNQKGYKVLKSMETVLAKGSSGQPIGEEMSTMIETYKGDIDENQLKFQLNYVHTQLESVGEQSDKFDWEDVLEFVRKANPCTEANSIRSN